MIYLPIFGKDSEPHSSSRLLSFCTTVFVWILFFVITILVFPSKEKKPEYEIVRIQLAPKKVEPEPIIEEIDLSKNFNQNQLLEPLLQELPKFAEAPAIPQKTQTLQKTASSAKTIESSKTTQKIPNNKSTQYNAKKQQSQNYSTIEEQLNAQLNGTKKAAVWDESKFSTPINSTSSSSKPSTVNEDSSFSGVQAKVNEYSQNKISTTQPNTQKKQNQKASESTSKALSQMMADSTVQNSSTQTKTSISSSKNSYGQTQIQMSDGSARTIIEPSTITINFSKQASQTITENHEVQISFTVNENGYVVGNISISLESLFSQIVRDEIRAQISRWRFESANNTSQAVFTLKMIKK